MDNEELIKAFDELSIENKKKEIINLMVKTEKLIESALLLEGFPVPVEVKRNSEIDESKNLSLLYENLWNLKNQLILLYQVSTNNKIGQ